MPRPCLKCASPFNQSRKINGRWHFSGKRKFCYECSPFGARNTRDLRHITVSDGQKKCCLCSETKPTAEFYSAKRRNGSIRVFSYCIACEKARQVAKNAKLKEQCIGYKGGKCTQCGYSRCAGALEFHHLDPTIKDESICNLRKSLWETIKAELDKCILVCANCHREIHAEIGADGRNRTRFTGLEAQGNNQYTTSALAEERGFEPRTPEGVTV